MDNQTEEQWLKGISRSTRGTGVFAFPEQLLGEFGQTDWYTVVDSRVYGSVGKALVSNIKYLDCVMRGSQSWVIAFKWVPETVASFNDVLVSATSCGAGLCAKRCAGYGCECIGGECK